MSDVQGWLTRVFEALEEGEEACLALIRGMPRSDGGGTRTVALVDGEITTLEALTYASILRELGQASEAEEVLRAVLVVELGWRGPLGFRTGARVRRGVQAFDGSFAIEA